MISNLQCFCALTGQAVAADSFSVAVIYPDAQAHIAVVIAPLLFDGDNRAGQGILSRQTLAVFQGIGPLHDHRHIPNLRQDIVPAMGDTVAFFGCDGSRQRIGDILLAQLIHIHSDRSILIGNDLDQIFAHIHRPNDFIEISAVCLEQIQHHIVHSSFDVIFGIEKLEEIHRFHIHRLCHRFGRCFCGCLGHNLLRLGGFAPRFTTAQYRCQQNCRKQHRFPFHTLHFLTLFGPHRRQ